MSQGRPLGIFGEVEAQARESRYSIRFSRFHGTVQQDPEQRQKTQIVRPCK